MFKSTLDNKPVVTNKDGEIKDLTESMINDNFTMSKFFLFKVPKAYEMRIDLISNEMYKSLDNAELIMKINGISNPFSIEEGDILAFPDQESITQMARNIITSTTGDESIRARYKYIDENRVPTVNNTITDFDNRDLTGGEILPPNIAGEDEDSLSYRNGRVYFGESIGVSACVKSGISSGEFLSKAIKNKK